jgi:hypothetical protein
MAIITPEAFNLKYKSEFPATVYTDLIPIATARAAIFPPQFRDLATEYFLGYILCMASGDPPVEGLKAFEVKPEGYSVMYHPSNTFKKCDRWLFFLKQLGIAAGVTIPELQSTMVYANRNESFYHPF